MRFLFASDSFKGTLSSEKIIELLTASPNNMFPASEIVEIPIADGGQGTLDVVRAPTDGAARLSLVTDA